MAEAANVRLVLCPKCENLLPELPDYSFYKCGGCGAILKANRKGIDGDGLTDAPNDTKVGGVTEEDGMFKASEVNTDSDSEIMGRKVEAIHNEEMVSTLEVESMKTAADSDQNGSRKESVKMLRSSADEHELHSQGLIRSKNPGESCDLNLDRPQYVTFHENGRDVRPPLDSLKSRPFMDQWNVKTAGSGPSSMRARGLPARGRPDDFLYHDEGPSSYAMAASYEQGHRTRYQGYDIDELARVENTGGDRAELLRRLDELRDKISGSCDIEAKSKERIGGPMRMAAPTSPDSYIRQNASYNQESLTSSRPGINPPFVRDEMGPPYRGHSSFSPYIGMYGPRMGEAYPKGGRAHELPLFPADTYRNEMVWRSSYHPHSQHMQQPYPDHLPHYYGDSNQELFVSHRHENRFHQPTCSCMHCYGKNQHMPSGINSQTFHTRKTQDKMRNPSFPQNLYPIPHRSQYIGSGGSSLHPLRSLQPQNSNKLDSGSDGSSFHHLRKLVVSHGSKRVNLPIAGGAPFVTCGNCFELVKLPRKHISAGKNPQKMRCGACSSIILFELGNKEFVASVSARADQVPTEIDESSIGTVDANVGYWNDDLDSANRNTFSDDFDDSQVKFSATDNNSNSGELKTLDPVSSSSSFSQDEQTLENVLSGKRGSPSEELLSKEANSFPDAHLSPRECFSHTPDCIVDNRLDKGNKSRTEERGSLDRTTSLQNSAKDQAVATEIDVPSNEFSFVSQESVQKSKEDRPIDRTTSLQNSAKDQAVATEIDVHSNEFSFVSQESVQKSKEDRPKANKGVESFLTGLVKKSFRDFKKLNESVEVRESQVFVNGHLIPDRAVKKAEKLAGPIQPGEYWYDKKAGFWGVMGHPCLGIIMPNIEEFNHPMPEDCAAGNTCVFINGRELHQKDLDLLCSRGLPITKNKSYLIHMTGEVVDEQTGEELESLGRLAPTVQRAKHGFGMRIPRSIAQRQS